MSLNVLQTITAPVGGVTQAPPELRGASQLAEAINTFPSLTRGLGVRKGTQTVNASLGVAAPAGAHEIEWSPASGERYLITVTSAGLVATDLATGQVRSVTVLGDAAAFLAGGVFTSAIIGDRVYIASKGYSKAQWTSALAPAQQTAALVTVTQGAPSALYKLTIDGISISVRTPDDPPPATKRPAVGLAINTGDGLLVAVSPAGFNPVAGDTVHSTITVTRLGGYTGSIALSATPPAGIAVSISTPTTTSSTTVEATATLSVDSSLASGFYTVPIHVTGTSGISDSADILLGVTALGGGGGGGGGGGTTGSFVVHTDNPVTIEQGASGTTTATVARLGGYDAGVTLVASGVPSGVTVGFSPNPTTGTLSTVSITVGSGATPGLHSITVTGNGPGASSSSSTLSLTVTVPESSGPSISLSASNVSMASNSGTSVAVVVTRHGGFTGDVTVTLGSVPTGLSADFPDGLVESGTTTAWLSINTILGCPPGNYTLTFTASGSGVDSVNGSLVVTVT